MGESCSDISSPEEQNDFGEIRLACRCKECRLRQSAWLKLGSRKNISEPETQKSSFPEVKHGTSQHI